MKKFTHDARELLSTSELYEIKAGENLSRYEDCILCSQCMACTTCVACSSKMADVIVIGETSTND